MRPRHTRRQRRHRPLKQKRWTWKPFRPQVLVAEIVLGCIALSIVTVLIWEVVEDNKNSDSAKILAGGLIGVAGNIAMLATRLIDKED